MTKMLLSLVLIMALLVDVFLTIVTFTIYLWLIPNEKMVFVKALKYYVNKILYNEHTCKF